MAFVFDDRCFETSTAPGIGSFTMNGAVQGAQSFASALTSNGDTTWYAATNGTAWETGLLTRTSATVYARTTIFRSTNANAAVNFATGTVSVWCDLPGVKSKVLERLAWATAAITPPTNDGTALGTGALSFSDLFLASGGVLNFNNGNYTVTHSAGLLSFSGALAVAGDVSATGALKSSAATSAVQIDTSGQTAVVVANGANSAIAPGISYGRVTIADLTSGYVAEYILYGGVVATVVLSGNFVAPTTTPAAGKVTVSYNGSNYAIYNNFGSSVTFKVTVTKTH